SWRMSSGILGPLYASSGITTWILISDIIVFPPRNVRLAFHELLTKIPLPVRPIVHHRAEVVERARPSAILARGGVDAGAVQRDHTPVQPCPVLCDLLDTHVHDLPVSPELLIVQHQ